MLPRVPVWLWSTLVPVMLATTSCGRVQQHGPGSQEQPEPYRFNSLIKSDINQVMDIHVRETREQLRLLMEKLYRRNPRELEKSPYRDATENINRIFSRTSNWHFRELDGIQGTDAIGLALSDGYRGDRVFAFMAGLTSMIMAAYHNKTQFYLYDNVDPQGFYNSARNVEIAVWKLSNTRNASGELHLYSNSLPGEASNLSYERLFGKLIALQDTMAAIQAGRTNRAITKVVQRMATAVFLPIP